MVQSLRLQEGFEGMFGLSNVNEKCFNNIYAPAENHLDRIRTDFVDSVSEEILKRLLDDLQTDGIVNKAEIEEILQKNQTRGDKARCLIDYVRKKGENACSEMMKHLQANDPELSSKLGLSSGPSKQKGKAQYRIRINTNSIFRKV